jgi:hypothetical protein
MDYRITRAISEIGQIEVTYTHEGKDVATYAIDVPVVNGAFITSTALDAEIRHRAPTWLIDREQQIKTATGFNDIVALVQENPAPPVNVEAQANAEMWAQVEFEKKVAKALVKFGVLQSDPTAIEVTQL